MKKLLFFYFFYFFIFFNLKAQDISLMLRYAISIPYLNNDGNLLTPSNLSLRLSYDIFPYKTFSTKYNAYENKKYKTKINQIFIPNIEYISTFFLNSKFEFINKLYEQKFSNFNFTNNTINTSLQRLGLGVNINILNTINYDPGKICIKYDKKSFKFKGRVYLFASFGVTLFSPGLINLQEINIATQKSNYYTLESPISINYYYTGGLGLLYKIYKFIDLRFGIGYEAFNLDVDYKIPHLNNIDHEYNLKKSYENSNILLQFGVNINIKEIEKKRKK